MALRGQGAKARRTATEAPPLENQDAVQWSNRSRQKQVRLGAEQVTALVAAYRNGAPLRELAESFGVHESTVRGHLVRNGVAKRPYRRLRDEDLRVASELYLDGQSLRSVAEAIGISREAVRSGLISAGVPLRGRGRRG